MLKIGNVRAGISANLLSQAFGIFIQILSVPLFLTYWTSDRYGDWLLITAIPAYLALMDFGIGASVYNRMLRSIANGEADNAKLTFQRAIWTLVSLLAVTTVLGCTAAVLYTYIFGDTSALSTGNALLIALLAAGTGLSLLQNIAIAPLKAIGHFHTSVHIGTASRIIEFGGIASILIAGGDELAICTAMLAARAITLIFTLLQSQRLAKWVSCRWVNPVSAESLILMKNGLPLLAFPLINASLNQGILLAVGLAGTSASVALVSTVAMLARLAMQIVNSVTTPFLPEICLAFHRGAINESLALSRIAFRASVLMGLSTSIIIGMFGPTFIKLWTSNALDPSYVVLCLFAAANAVRAVWLPSALIVSATDRGHLLVVGQAIAALGCVAFIALLSPPAHVEASAGIFLIIAEILNIFIVWRVFMPQMNEKTSSYLKAIYTKSNPQ